MSNIVGMEPDPANRGERKSLPLVVGGDSINARNFLIGLALALQCAGCGSNKVESKASSTTFGQRQIDQMLQDRPDMRNALPNSHPVLQWLTAGFDGERFGQRIYWNGSSPHSGRPAEHAPPHETYPPYIAISGGTETTAIDKWASVVYEMYNLENTDQFRDVSKSAMQGSLDADGFAEKCVELEFSALKKTHEFFTQNPLPKSKHGRDAWYNWVVSDFGSFEDYKEAFDAPWTNSFNSNFAYFKEYYKTTIVPYSEMMREKTIVD